jgi:mRNA interferase RelE/StbE
MRYEIIFAPEAVQDFKRLSVRDHSIVRDAIEQYLRYEPETTSKSRMKRLRGISRPQYRLRIGEIRVFYDVVQQDNDPRFLARVATARKSLREEKGVRLEDLPQ